MTCIQWDLFKSVIFLRRIESKRKNFVTSFEQTPVVARVWAKKMGYFLKITSEVLQRWVIITLLTNVLLYAISDRRLLLINFFNNFFVVSSASLETWYSRLTCLHFKQPTSKHSSCLGNSIFIYKIRLKSGP